MPLILNDKKVSCKMNCPVQAAYERLGIVLYQNESFILLALSSLLCYFVYYAFQ